jgi:CTP:molybdopterin cytidylyltransferase MocA
MENEDNGVSEEKAVEEVAHWMGVNKQALKIWLATGVRWTARTLWEMGKAGVLSVWDDAKYGEKKYRR